MSEQATCLVVNAEAAVWFVVPGTFEGWVRPVQGVIAFIPTGKIRVGVRNDATLDRLPVTATITKPRDYDIKRHPFLLASVLGESAGGAA